MSAGHVISLPWMTVIILSHCGEQWIDVALGSFAAQAVEGLEVLVIDSSPTSAILNIARRYSHEILLRVVALGARWRGASGAALIHARTASDYQFFFFG
jgi:hypothetical protein